ncbi:hypothetical protein [Nocardioides sp. LML1-1-1.1]|uniref:hypothetical protein n=1 Tax=Nocardioides sp. LML1-1-1.1 TaxID=3135248 RepID=UPI00343BCD6A
MSGGAHAAPNPLPGPLWSRARYGSASGRRPVEIALLVLLSVALLVVAVADGRSIGQWWCVAGVAGVLAAPGFRPAGAVPMGAGSIVVSAEAALRGAFDGAQAVIGLGSMAALLLVISAVGFRDDDDRRRTWGEPRTFLPSEPGPLLAWSRLRDRGLRFLGELASVVLGGAVLVAYAVVQDANPSPIIVGTGTLLVLASAPLRAPLWPVVCWLGLVVAVAGSWASISSRAALGSAVPLVALAFVIRECAWSSAPAADDTAALPASVEQG